MVDLTPEQLVSCIDFRYITDAITPNEAADLLRVSKVEAVKRMNILEAEGYPAYTTQVGWLGYSNAKISELTKKYLELGYTAFKLKVGQDLKDDINRCKLVRQLIGWKNKLVRLSPSSEVHHTMRILNFIRTVFRW